MAVTTDDNKQERDQDQTDQDKATTATATATTVLDGAAKFEQWWSDRMKDKFDSEDWPVQQVRTATFGPYNLRGLQYTGGDTKTTNTMDSDNEEGTQVLAVPRSLCLWAPYPEDKKRGIPWDVSLAIQLWDEMKMSKQPNSSNLLSGFCSLLWQGKDGDGVAVLPPSTAPDALRHWTDEEKSWLASTGSSDSAGAKLVRREKLQQHSWRILYDTHVNVDNVKDESASESMSWEEFQWSMEAVYSRSFSGDFGNGPVRLTLTSGSDRVQRLVASLLKVISLPIAAIGVALAFLNDSNWDSTENLALCAVSICIIGGAFLLGDDNKQATSTSAATNKVKSTPVAVMAPFMDLANHVDGAESTVEYDALLDAMTLTIDNNNKDPSTSTSTCLIHDPTTDTQQLCISYGQHKTPEEFLLNYGFLPMPFASSLSGDDEDIKNTAKSENDLLSIQKNQTHELRRTLANTFLSLPSRS
jgi:hypothetical protein